jgi:hypothetical protein
MDLKGLLASLAGVMAVLFTFAALILYAMGKINDGQGGRGEGMMIGCACAAVACTGAAAWILTQNLTIIS